MVIEQREQGRFIVLSPETSAENSAMLVQRIQAAAVEHLGVNVKCGVASFPDSALTFDDLVHQAENRIQRVTAVEQTHTNTNGSGPTHSDDIDELQEAELAPSRAES
jgi:GGDEF domain-containing protein